MQNQTRKNERGWDTGHAIRYVGWLRCGRSLPTVVVALFAIAIGIMAILIVSKLFSKRGGLRSLATDTIRSGDIEVRVQECGSREGERQLPDSNQGSGVEIWMTKDDVPFLLLNQNRSGQTMGLYLLGEGTRPILMLEPASLQGKWRDATYSSIINVDKSNRGEVLKDIDFDGQFDFRLVADGNGVVHYIRLKGVWEKTENCSPKMGVAVIAGKTYIFDLKSGRWREE